MYRGYIYLISFKGTNDIYIGKTIYNIYERFKQHKTDKSTVHFYVKTKLDGNWNNVDIDVIDSIDMNEDLTHLFNHPLNIQYINIVKSIKYNHSFKKFTLKYTSNEQLLKARLEYAERFHIQNYKNEGKYNLINKQIYREGNLFEIYKFYQYS